MTEFTVQPVAYVRSSRREIVEDNWDEVATTIELEPPYDAEALLGLDGFSHLEVVFVFDQVPADRPVHLSRHPRGNEAWPVVGVFAQRGPFRPNRIGVTVCELLSVEGTTLTVRGLDAVDGTPVLDLKPYLEEFAPRSAVRQPSWSRELMQHYF